MANNVYLLRAVVVIRVRWYSVCTSRILLRHWQLVVLSLAFIPMGLSGSQLLAVFGSPFLIILDTSASFLERFGILIFICLLSVAWVYLQRSHVIAEEFEQYFRTLPLPPIVLASADIVVLCMATSVLLLPSVAAMFADKQIIELSVGRRVFSLSAIVCVIVLCEYSVMRRRWKLMISGLFANIVLSVGLGFTYGLTWMIAPFLTLVILTAGVWLEPNYPIYISRNRGNDCKANSINRIRQLELCKWSLWLLPWRVLRANAKVSVPRVVLASGIALATLSMQSALLYDHRARFTSVVALGIVALILSGLYRLLNETHISSHRYFSALPIRTTCRAWFDISCVASLGALISVVIILNLLKQNLVSVNIAALLLLLTLVLLAVLRLPAVRAEKNALLLAVLITTAWSSIILLKLG